MYWPSDSFARMSPGRFMATIDAPVVVADAGPLIHLDELDALNVLADYPKIWVPEEVWGEIVRHRPGVLQHRGIPLVRHESTVEFAEVNALATLYTLHRGERAALTLCLERSLSTLLSDDTAARLAAASLNLVTHGTIGLLIRAARRGLRTSAEVLTLLDALPHRSTLHIRPSLLQDLIRQLRLEWSVPDA